MKCGGLATRAELLELKTVWVVTTVLLGDVVALFAVDAGHGDLWTYVRTLACHGLAPLAVLVRVWVFMPALCQGVRVPDDHACREIARAELVAEAGFEPATQRL